MSFFNFKLNRDRASVVHVINRMEIGGVEVGVLSLLKSQFSNDYKVLTVKGCSEEIYDSLSESEKKNIIVCNGYIESFRFLLKLKPRLIVSSLWRAHAISIFYKLFNWKLKRVHFVHYAGFGHLVNNLITYISVYMSTFVFTDSSRSKDWLENEFRGKSGIVVPMNVSFSNESIQNNLNPLSFVFVGRFCKQKNLIDSFRFIQRLLDYGLKPTFDLYGRDDGELVNLQSYVRENGLSSVVTFHENVLPTLIESKIRLYNFYLQSSLVEGMAISVYQSIKNGLLPVVTPVGEIINYTEDGVNALYLNGLDINKSADEFVEMISSGKIKSLDVGRIINEENYPNFDKAFFSQLKHSIK